MNISGFSLIKKAKIALGFVIFALVILWATGSGMGFILSLTSEEAQATTFVKVLFSIFAVGYALVFYKGMKSVEYEDPGCGLSGFVLFVMLLVVSPLLCGIGLAIPSVVLFPQLQDSLNTEVLFSNHRTLFLSALIIICFYACMDILLQIAVWIFTSVLRKVRS